MPRTAIVADDGGSVIVALDGGRWDNIQKVNLNVLQFGAKGDGVTDDTWAIQSCYNAITLGGTLRIPAAPGGSYACSPQNGNAYVFYFSRFINIQADGFNSSLAPAASTTTDTILCQPVATVAYLGMFWDGLCLGTPSTGQRNGRHGIYIDTTQTVSIGVEFSGFKCSRTYVGQSNSNGNAFIHSNSAANNANGGMFSAMICDCPGLNGGVVLNQSGDSNHIERNVITGNGIGVTATLVSGASELTILGNNITTNGGQIVINSGSRTRIENNNIEQRVATTGSTVMINLTGSSGTMVNCSVIGNHLGAFTGSNMTANILIGVNVLGTTIDQNTMLNANVGFTGPAVNDAGTSTRIGFNQYGTNLTTPITPGTGCMGVKRALTLINSWTNISGTAYVFKSWDGVVTIEGFIASGTTTSGTTITSLPDSNYWPDTSLAFGEYSFNGSTPVLGGIQVTSAGAVVILTGANTQLGLMATYPAVGAGQLSSNA